MLKSKELLSKAGVVSKLRLAVKNEKGIPTSTGAHRVKMLEDKLAKGLDHQGKERHEIHYFVEENGEKKVYKVAVHAKDGITPNYLVERLSEIEEGEEIILEFKKQGMKGFIQVTKVSESANVELEDDDIESRIPIIEQEDESEQGIS